ncbi:MAG: hypothetical protein ACI4QE_01680, partial [Acutalibacteraceae bacterium]
ERLMFLGLLCPTNIGDFSTKKKVECLHAQPRGERLMFLGLLCPTNIGDFSSKKKVEWLDAQPRGKRLIFLGLLCPTVFSRNFLYSKKVIPL